MFVTVCYFIAAEIFLLEPKDGGRGLGWEVKELGPHLLFIRLWGAPSTVSYEIHQFVFTHIKSRAKSFLYSTHLCGPTPPPHPHPAATFYATWSKICNLMGELLGERKNIHRIDA